VTAIGAGAAAIGAGGAVGLAAVFFGIEVPPVSPDALLVLRDSS
jgi:hypothetical protein